ncbi:MAG: excinuclease ABC subunit UvrB [Actinobacteria bacterium]|nr:excinuclease ABC subunit UvrB [Actinomycetota bacterium]MCL5882673.1 excinuclease ABC subunit UvrB [Actinomycetota bacterium]
MSIFKINSTYQPTGDQPEAIKALSGGIVRGNRYQTLLGVTGSGKTFTMAQVIARAGKPALVMAHNKTLAAQLCNEFKEFLPDNAVEYFVSYYDYYQPEAYLPASDTYIEKDSAINQEIDRLRHSATAALLSRRDVVIVASVSCIYGLGSPEEYLAKMVLLKVGDEPGLEAVTRRLVDIQYSRGDFDFGRGQFRLRGDVLEVHPAYEDTVLRIGFYGDEVERIQRIDAMTGEVFEEMKHVAVYPATHFVTSPEAIERALVDIQAELNRRLAELKREGKELEAHRLLMRTRYDMEMLRETGFCSGIENYSRILDGRAAGEPPHTLLDFFPDDFLCFIDESHNTVPQIGGMYNGDRSRKQTLIDYGFRLPSALDNRPLRFEEFLDRVPQIVFVSATPGPWELNHSSQVVEQVIRPTGLIDPEVEVRPTEHQVDDLMNEVRKRVEAHERVLVTTLTKKMAEDLTDYLLEMGFKVRYLHSDIDTLQRIEIVRDLRLGEFDVLVGVNLLREGLDLPEVTLVAIMDADKEGFLRGEIALIQTIGRAARNVRGKVIMYADKITRAMTRAIEETNRRRTLQTAYNVENDITPRTIVKGVSDMAAMLGEQPVPYTATRVRHAARKMSQKEIDDAILLLEEEMFAAAEELRFEYAAKLRDQVKELVRQRAAR